MSKFADIFETEPKHWTGNDVINAIEEMDSEKPVYFANTVHGYHGHKEYPVNSFFSWRGSYDQPSISTEGDKVYLASELIDVLNEFFSSTQTGWKGGKFAIQPAVV